MPCAHENGTPADPERACVTLGFAGNRLQRLLLDLRLVSRRALELRSEACVASKEEGEPEAGQCLH